MRSPVHAASGGGGGDGGGGGGGSSGAGDAEGKSAAMGGRSAAAEEGEEAEEGGGGGGGGGGGEEEEEDDDDDAARVIARFVRRAAALRRTGGRSAAAAAFLTAKQVNQAQAGRRSSFIKARKGKGKGKGATAHRPSVHEGGEVLMEGYAKKRSTGFRKAWQARFFVVAGHYLKYYADERKAEVKGAVDLGGLRSAIAVSGGAAADTVDDWAAQTT